MSNNSTYLGLSNKFRFIFRWFVQEDGRETDQERGEGGGGQRGETTNIRRIANGQWCSELSSRWSATVRPVSNDI